MIKASGRGATGRPVVILGLSGENVTRLMAGEPIKVDLGELLPQLAGVDMLLCGGRTEAVIAKDLVAAGWLPPDFGQQVPEALRGGTETVRWTRPVRKPPG